MQTVVVFAALICAAVAQTVVKSDRLGGNFAYSISENKHHVVVPATYGTIPTTYGAIPTTYGAYPTTYGAIPTTYAAASPVYYGAHQVAGTHHTVVAAPVALTRSVVAANTPANTYKTLAGVSPLHYNTVYGYPTHNGYQIAY